MKTANLYEAKTINQISDKRLYELVKIKKTSNQKKENFTRKKELETENCMTFISQM